MLVKELLQNRSYSHKKKVCITERLKSSYTLMHAVPLMIHVFLCIAPSKAPMITSLFRVDAQTANLSWEFLTLEELRGFLYTYEVVYFTTIKGIQCSDAQPELSNTQSAETNNILITDLDPVMEYCVGVAASTVVDVGNYSYEYLPCKFQHVCTHTCFYKRINPHYDFTQYSHMRKNLLRFQLLP